MTQHEQWMKQALREAEKAFEQDEVPVGAVVVYENRVIGRGCNQMERLQDPTAHAEMIALTQAAGTLGDWRLNETTLYVTKEPCFMCAGALVLSRVKHLVYGVHDQRNGGAGSAHRA